MTRYSWHRKSLGLFSQLSSLRGSKGHFQIDIEESCGSKQPLSNKTEGTEVIPLDQSAAVELAPQRTCFSQLPSTERDSEVNHPVLSELEPSNVFGDNERTNIRYSRALKKLERTLTLSVSSGETSQLLNIMIDEIHQHDQITYLREQVDKMLDREARESLRGTRAVLHRIFKAITPISKTLLTIAVQGQPVNPFLTGL
jgi:hypothetical protein